MRLILELSSTYSRRKFGHEVLGISPMQFFRRKRLRDVHTALLMAKPGMTVEGIAVEHGFLDGGRFPREYRLQFGEQPSETLRRRNGAWRQL